MNSPYLVSKKLLFLILLDVNANATLLPNFQLSMVWNNTNCAARPALAAAVWQFTTIPDLVGVIGEGCSVASEPIALLGGVYKMPQISYGRLFLGDISLFQLLHPLSSLMVFVIRTSCVFARLTPTKVIIFTSLNSPYRPRVGGSRKALRLEACWYPQLPREPPRLADGKVFAWCSRCW